MVAAVEACQGVNLVGCRRTRWLLDGRPELDLLNYLIAAERGLQNSSTWHRPHWTRDGPSCARLPGDSRDLRSSLHTHDDRAPESMPVRAGAWQDAAEGWAYSRWCRSTRYLSIGRDDGPGFVRSEIAHAERVIELATKTLERMQQGASASRESPSYLTISEPA